MNPDGADVSRAVPAKNATAVAVPPVQRRWHILRLQLRAGHAPCFGTELRHRCGERHRCAFSAECLALRAVWR